MKGVSPKPLALAIVTSSASKPIQGKSESESGPEMVIWRPVFWVATDSILCLTTAVLTTCGITMIAMMMSTTSVPIVMPPHFSIRYVVECCFLLPLPMTNPKKTHDYHNPGVDVRQDPAGRRGARAEQSGV